MGALVAWGDFASDILVVVAVGWAFWNLHRLRCDIAILLHSTERIDRKLGVEVFSSTKSGSNLLHIHRSRRRSRGGLDERL